MDWVEVVLVVHVGATGIRLEKGANALILPLEYWLLLSSLLSYFLLFLLALFAMFNVCARFGVLVALLSCE
jgi:hypothetical protein